MLRDIDNKDLLIWKRVKSLTRKEFDIFEDLLLQKSQIEISEKHQITKKTTKYHISNIYEKLKVPEVPGTRSKRLQFNLMCLDMKPKEELRVEL